MSQHQRRAERLIEWVSLWGRTSQFDDDRTYSQASAAVSFPLSLSLSLCTIYTWYTLRYILSYNVLERELPYRRAKFSRGGRFVMGGCGGTQWNILISVCGSRSELLWLSTKVNNYQGTRPWNFTKRQKKNHNRFYYMYNICRVRWR